MTVFRSPQRDRLVGATALAVLVLAASLVRAAGPAPRQIDNVPDAMIDTWGWDGESCGLDDDGRITVSARSVAFFAASYDLQSITEEGDGTIRALAIVHEEGESETARGTIRLKLVPANSLWVRTDNGLDHAYVSCKH